MRWRNPPTGDAYGWVTQAVGGLDQATDTVAGAGAAVAPADAAAALQPMPWSW